MRHIAFWFGFIAAACNSVHNTNSDGATDGSSNDGKSDGNGHGETRADGAWRIPIALAHSIQNPCFSPDGTQLAVTNWLGGYNVSPAVVAVVATTGGAAHAITAASATSVNLPGSCWRGDRITYSSDPNDDEIYTNAAAGGSQSQVTNRADKVAYEPSFSPDGAWIVFESHPLDVETRGAIYKVRADGSGLVPLTDGSGDDREPNWSPAGDLIVFQSHARTPGDIDLWVMNSDGTGVRNLTQSPGSEDTDASWSPDGTRVVYSSNHGGLANANLFTIPVAGGTPTRVTHFSGYDGAPTWSADGSTIAFESSARDPDGSPGTAIWAITAP